MEGAVGAAGEGGFEDVLGAGVRFRAGVLEAGVGFGEGEDIEEVVGRGGVDAAAVLAAAVVEDDDGRQPDDVEAAYVGVAELEAEWNERFLDGGDDGGVWIRHGIQQLAAYSVLLFDVDEEEPALLAGANQRRVPVVLPDDLRSICIGHQDLQVDAPFA